MSVVNKTTHSPHIGINELILFTLTWVCLWVTPAEKGMSYKKKVLSAEFKLLCSVFSFENVKASQAGLNLSLTSTWGLWCSKIASIEIIVSHRCRMWTLYLLKPLSALFVCIWRLVSSMLTLQLSIPSCLYLFSFSWRLSLLTSFSSCSSCSWHLLIMLLIAQES